MKFIIGSTDKYTESGGLLEPDKMLKAYDTLISL